MDLVDSLVVEEGKEGGFYLILPKAGYDLVLRIGLERTIRKARSLSSSRPCITTVRRETKTAPSPSRGPNGKGSGVCQERMRRWCIRRQRFVDIKAALNRLQTLRWQTF